MKSLYIYIHTHRVFPLIGYLQPICDLGPPSPAQSAGHIVLACLLGWADKIEIVLDTESHLSMRSKN